MAVVRCPRQGLSQDVVVVSRAATTGEPNLPNQLSATFRPADLEPQAAEIDAPRSVWRWSSKEAIQPSRQPGAR